MHPEIHAQLIRSRHNDLRREADAARRARDARSTRHTAAAGHDSTAAMRTRTLLRLITGRATT